MLSGSELWLLRLMADRGLALLDATTLLIAIEEKGELRVAAAAGVGVRLRIVPVRGSALGELYLAGEPVSLDRPRGREAAILHEIGLEARAVLIEPLSMEAQGGGLVIAARADAKFGDPERKALQAFAASVAQRLAAERSVEIERLRYGMEARERERTRWAREIHDESIQGIGALRMRLANARDIDDRDALSAAVEEALEGLGTEIDGLRHLITELRPAALDDLGLAAALEALARRAQAIDGLDVTTQIEFGRDEDLPPGDVHEVIASVTDDGKGMPDATRLGPREDGGGFGTGGMRERAELVGGDLEWLPAPGKGTIVRLTVPLAGRPTPQASPQPA